MNISEIIEYIIEQSLAVLKYIYIYIYMVREHLSATRGTFAQLESKKKNFDTCTDELYLKHDNG